MSNPIITEEDKKLVGALVKKKKQASNAMPTTKKVKRINRSSHSSKTNVYFNKGNSSGGTYLTGDFYSGKNDSTFKYRSSYELKFFQMLEEDKSIINYASEAFSVPYLDSNNNLRNYIPDILALTDKGNFTVFEIKPEDMLKDLDVQRKAQACKIFIKKTFGKTSKYEFITEKYLFENNKDYTNFLKEMKK